MSEYIWYLSFLVWVTSLNRLFSRSIHLPVAFKMSFFFCHVLLHCVNVPDKEHLGCFQVLVMTNNATMNIVEHVFLWYDCASFWYIPQNGISGSWGRLFYNFLRNCHTDIQSDIPVCTLTSNGGVFHLPPHPLQHKLSSVFLILAILTVVR